MNSIKTDQNAARPVRWVVVVSATDPVTGGHVSKSHECRDLPHARGLLTELRDLAEEFGEYLPGLSVDGYELADEISITQAGLAALAAAEAKEAQAAVHPAPVLRGAEANPILAAVAGWLTGGARA